MIVFWICCLWREFRKDKWNESGGNQVISNVSSALPQGLKDNIEQAKSQLFSKSKVRNPMVFFGIGEEKPFYLERSPPLIMARLQHNSNFFLLNYMMITALFFVITLLISPSAIFGIGVIGLSWASFVRAFQNGSTTIRGITVSQKQASIVMCILSGLFLFYLLKSVFWYSIFSSAFVVAGHAFFRDASMHKDEEDKVEMTGDMEIGETDAFLNPTAQG